MTEPEEMTIGRILNAAVPDLRAPEDRMAGVAARLGRKRRNTALAALAAAVVVTTMLWTLPQILVSATGPGQTGAATAPPSTEPTLGGDGCPVSAPPQPSLTDISGQLVPTGATSVTLCELILDPSVPGLDPEVMRPRVLTSMVDRLVTLLNLLPDPEQWLAELREREEAAGRALPPDYALGCDPVGYPTVLSFVLRYPDRTPVVVWDDRKCGTMTSGGRTRRYILFASPFQEFLVQYRAQLLATTDPDSVPTPVCPASLPARQLDPSRVEGLLLRDGIGRNRLDSDPFLPVPLVALAACRYDVSPSGARLVTSHAERDSLTLQGMRDALHEATGSRTSPQTPGVAINSADCFGLPEEISRMIALDVVLVTDATGAVSEVRVWRKHCAAVVTQISKPFIPTLELSEMLDSWLAP